jgi:hypothetical protein
MIDRDTFDSACDPAAQGPTQPGASETMRCPKCGRPVNSPLCGHCGSRLPEWQAALYGAAVRKLAATGGDRTDTAKKGGGRREDPDGQEYDETIANDLRQVECPFCGKHFPI